MKYDLTIIVPVYNEEDNLERLERELSKYLKIAQKPACVLLTNSSLSKQLIKIEREKEK